MPRDTTKRISSQEARRLARIANGKDPDDLSDVYHGRPTRPKKLVPVDRPPTPYVPATPLSLASQLGIRPVQLAQAVQAVTGAPSDPDPRTRESSAVLLCGTQVLIERERSCDKSYGAYGIWP